MTEAEGWALASRLRERMASHPLQVEFQGAGGCFGADGRGLQSILLWGHPKAIADSLAAEGLPQGQSRVWIR